MSDLSEYLTGSRKEQFERTAAHALSLIGMPAERAVRWHARRHGVEQSVIDADRVLGLARSFTLPKLNLKRPDGSPIPGCEILEGVGLDELPQIREARLGRVAVVHVRPIHMVDLDRRYERVAEADRGLADDWVYLRDQVTNYDGGITGPFQIPFHENAAETDASLHARLEVDYLLNADLRKDMELIGGTALSVLRAML